MKLGIKDAIESALLHSTAFDNNSALRRWLFTKDVRYEWDDFCRQIIRPERLKLMSVNSRLKELNYYFENGLETSAQLIGEALLEDIAERTEIDFHSERLSVYFPSSFAGILALIRKLKSPTEIRRMVCQNHKTNHRPELD